MFQFENDGPLLVSTNYWASQHAARGFFFGSWNAGALRVLVPPTQEPAISEMRTGKDALLSTGKIQGREMLQIVFDDRTDSPYAISIDMQMTDRRLSAADQAPGSQAVVAIYTARGKQFELKGRWE